MNTVINLNILNFFRVTQSYHTLNDVRINNNFSSRKKDDIQVEDRVIDITPYNHALEGSRDVIVRDMQPTDKNNSHAQLALSPAAVDNTYDRRGNAIRIYDSKGMHIDSYI